MPASWTFDLCDVNGIPLTEGGLNLATGASLNFQLCAPTIVQFTLPLSSADAATIASTSETDYYVKAYRLPAGGNPLLDKSLRFYGSVWVDEVQGRNGGDVLVVTALDQLALLSKRFTLAQFAPTDQGTLLKTMVDTSNTTDGETGILTSASYITASTSIDLDARTNKPSILSLVQQFSGQLDGCEAWLVPIELASGKISQLWASPRRGSAQTAVFSYGATTEANCSGMTRVRDKNLMVNDVEGYADALTSSKTNATSINAYRRLVEYISMTGETAQTVLDNRAQGRLDDRGTKAAVAKYTCAPGPSAPPIFDTWDIGDTVNLEFSQGSVEWQVAQRVYAATVRVKPGGAEQLASVDLRAA